MNYFAIVLGALDTLVDGICRHRNLQRPVAMQMAAAHLQTMRDEWFSGDTPNIAYEDPLCRFAYLYCHTAVNANLCEFCIRDTEDVSEHINETLDANGELRVCAFGGGPGTELLALAKHLCNTRQADRRVTSRSRCWTLWRSGVKAGTPLKLGSRIGSVSVSVPETDGLSLSARRSSRSI